MRSKLICLTVLLSGVSLSALAYEAPVVDVTAQQSANADAVPPTQEMSGGSWQPVANNDNPPNSAAPTSQNGGWQTVSNNESNSVPNQDQPNMTAQAQSAPQQVMAQASAPREAHNSKLDQRVSRLEQQMANNNSMNLPQQVSDLHNQVAQLQGQLEVDQHQLATLTKQQKLYYQDIEQQLASNQNLPNKKAQLTDDSAASQNTVAARAASPQPDDQSENMQANAQKNDQLGQFHDMALSKKTPSLSDADSYGKAFQLLSNKHFNGAQTAFNQYLNDYPSGHFAVNAHFWLGEIALMDEKYQPALKQFNAVVAEYPTSKKVPDAKLKIAMIHAATGKMQLARKEFSQIRKTYPGSTAAQLASIRLQQLANATSTTLQ